MEKQGLALSYEDVLLKTGYSQVSPADVSLAAKFSRRISLNCPIVSSPMDTVTEHAMAIAVAKMGGIGIIHRAMTAEEQAREVAHVKYYLNGFIDKPICVNEKETMASLIKRREEKGYSFHSFPVINDEGKLVGLLTRNDFEFCTDDTTPVAKVMSTELITAKEGASIAEAFNTMQKRKKKILPLIDPEGRLTGMYVFSDVKRIITGSSSEYNIDKNGQLRVGAAVGVGQEALERTGKLREKGVDVVVIDTAHGDTEMVIATLKQIKQAYPDLDVVAGNISEADSAKRLAEAGADGIKVGQGPGSTCTTRIVAGIGCPQVTAVFNCSRAVEGSGVPICADGGIEYSGHITIALGAGADCVMLGNLLAGTKETPGEMIIKNGLPYKNYRGMGSLGAMAKREVQDRYQQTEVKKNKLVPEGLEGTVPYKGEVAGILFQCLGGLRSGMGYLGAANIQELKEKANFYRITEFGLKESHPHGILMTKESPNYH